jgi:hypothetical protein
MPNSPVIMLKVVESNTSISTKAHKDGYQIWKYVDPFDNVQYCILHTALDIIHAVKQIKDGTEPVCIYREGKLTDEGMYWWREIEIGIEPPKAIV